MKKTIINSTLSLFSLLVFVGCNSTNESDTKSQVTEWAVKLNAIDSEGKLGDTNIPLGQVYPATDDIDRYDLVSAPPPFGGEFMEILYQIEGSESEFSTNYHSVKKDQYDTWTFVVKTNDPDRTVTLSWPGIFKVNSATDEYNRVRLYNEFLNYDSIMEKMQLVDMKSGEVVSAVSDGQVQNYTFNMDGETERTFKWEYLSEKAVIQPQDIFNKESAIELGKQYRRSYEKKINLDSLPPEFDEKETN